MAEPEPKLLVLATVRVVSDVPRAAVKVVTIWPLPAGGPKEARLMSAAIW